MHKSTWYITILVLLCVSGCGSLQKKLSSNVLEPAERYTQTDNLLKNNGFESIILSAEVFDVAAWANIKNAHQPISIFIEGDGFAYYSRHHISDDPTPTNAIAAKIAVNDLSDNRIYLARPCQYIINHGSNSTHCRPSIWTRDRFSKNMLILYHDLLDELAERYNNKSGFHIVGYSGGGVFATLLGMFRDDVIDATAIASPLDIKAFIRYHRLSRLYAVNPFDYKKRLYNTNLTLYLGSDDQIINKDVLEDFLDDMAGRKNFKLIEIENFEHEDDWHHIWQ
ncbi:MAG: hypothetical protein AAF403_01035 [Pseudomonadota bacterium]